MLTLKNKIIFITGASSGIGAACAEVFAEQGAKLLLCARRLEKLNTLAETLRKKYQTAVLTFKLDVSDEKAVNTAISALPADYKNIDVLINNAGGAHGMEKVVEADTANWNSMIDINVKGLLYVTKAVIPGMLARNSGHIINIGSTSSHRVYAGGSVYCATKHAVNAITRTLKLELYGTPLRVTEIDPGAVETEFSIVRFKGDQQRADKVYEKMQPLTGRDVAETILFCATRPAHVTINQLVVVPNDQASYG